MAKVKATLRARLRRLGWMGEATKAQAVDKLEAMGIKIGYPDVWRDYTALEVGRTS